MTEPHYNPTVEAELVNAKLLSGYTVTGLCSTPDGNSWGLILSRTIGLHRHYINAWIEQDPQGNGPGHIHVEQLEVNNKKPLTQPTP